MLAFIRSKIGWGEGDGIFSPGGSISNMYGMMLARHKRFPDLKSKGLSNAAPLVAFTSEESHYSIVKGANWMGLGTDNVVKVATDKSGRMRPEALHEAVKKASSEGKTPFFVNATAGSTVMGSFDDIDAIAEVCGRHDLWLHVDACWGGGALLSRRKRNLLSGIEKSDSVAWNPHKMIGAPLQCSPFITKHKRLLMETNSASASYLFQQDKFYDVSYDTGDKSVQCGRKVDGFKLWFMLKARGEEQLERLVDNAFDKAAYLYERILARADEGFRPAFQEGFSCTNVCFYFVPDCLKGREEDEEWMRKLAKVAPKVKELMIKDGSLMIGYQPLKHKNKVNFFRMVVHCQPEPTEADMDFVLDEIVKNGKNLEID